MEWTGDTDHIRYWNCSGATASDVALLRRTNKDSSMPIDLRDTIGVKEDRNPLMEVLNTFRYHENKNSASSSERNKWLDLKKMNASMYET